MADVSFERAIEFARDLIRIPSAPGAEDAVATRLRLELERLRFDEVWTDEAGNIGGIVRGRGGAPPVMLNCHLDVVDPGDAAEWAHPPYGAELADGFLHGRGAMDIKGPLALQTYAAARFVGAPADGDIVVAHTVLEERGGWGMAHLLESGRVRPAVVVIGEATNGDVCIGHRGRAELIVEVGGVAGHASAPERARNALDLLPHVLPALEEFAAALPSDDVLGRSTLVATGIDVSPTSPNVIPDRAAITLDWRVLPSMSAESVLEELRRHLGSRVRVMEGWRLGVRFGRERQRTYTGMEQERRLFTPGFLLQPGHPVVRAAVDAVARSTGRAPAVRPWTFATDGGHSCGVHGIPTVGFAPGEERYAHTNRERLAVEPARRAFAAYPDLIRAVMSAAA
ncbi:MAG: M20/M25/M40 family metallo-hydrolase [Longimicrobiales bacterium]